MKAVCAEDGRRLPLMVNASGTELEKPRWAGKVWAAAVIGRGRNC